MGKAKYLSAFERGAKNTRLYQDLKRCWIFNTQQFPMCIHHPNDIQPT
jgi:hypothetical protein